MAMLAEPKRRQKYGNDPRNTFWSNDESKFGFRMLESMGWKKGQGLGANEGGITEHVKTVKRSNTDTRGVGCSRSHADNWIAHQDVFNELLSSLNDAPSSSAASSEETPSVASLEEKSKSSRSRVHYHKFTRGKDLSSRSSHDLDCIFGKRKGQASENSTPTTQSEANSDEEGYEARPSFKLDTSTASNSNNDDGNVHGVKTITSSTSVHEYFAMKMAELKRKRNAATGSDNTSADSSEGSNSPNNTESNREESQDEPGAMVCGESACAGESKTQRRKKSKKASTNHEEGSPPGDSEGRAEVSQADPEASSSVLEVTQSQKSKKKSKKDKKKQDTSVHEANMNEVHGENSPTDAQLVSDTGKKRKKSKKRKSTEPGELEEKGNNNTSILRSESDSRTRHRKSVRFSVGADEVFTIPGKEESAPEDTVQQEEEEESLPMEEEKVSKKKKKKIKMEEAVELEAEVSEKMKKREEAIEEKVSKNKRKKKAATEEEASSKRKKREEATEENISGNNGEAITEGEIITVRKTEKAVEEKASRKKKKKKKREEATEEEASAERKKREEAKEEKVSTKKGEEATEGEVQAKKKSEEAVKETVSKKKKTEEVNGENVSRKREREETHSEEEGPPESKKPRVNKPAAVVPSCVKAELEGRKDSVLPAPQKTQSTPLNDVPCSQRSMVKRRAVKKPAKLSQDHIDRIHQRFEGTNLNCFSGYGQ